MSKKTVIILSSLLVVALVGGVAFYSPGAKNVHGEKRMGWLEVKGADNKPEVYDVILNGDGNPVKFVQKKSLSGGRTEMVEYDAKTMKMTGKAEISVVLSEGALRRQVTNAELISSANRRWTFSEGQEAVVNVGEAKLNDEETITFGDIEYSVGMFGTRTLKLNNGKISASTGWLSETNLTEKR